MTKKKKSAKPTNTVSSDPILNLDLKTLIHEHSIFFDKLVDFIPARFYLPVEDDNKPWFQGLSKTARASAKKETRQNIKKSRRERLDPHKSSTTLDLLKKSIQTEKSLETDTKSDETAIQIEQPLPTKESDRSMTYEELRLKFRRRMEELRGNRPDKGELERRRGFTQGKRKRDVESEEKKTPSAAAGSSGGFSVNEADVAFNQVKIGDEDGQKRKKKKLSKQQTLERAKKLEEAKKDPEKGQIVSKKHSWKAAVSRAAGVKIHDDPKLLKQSMKKEKKRHQKNAEKWKERVQSREKTRADKQQTRAGNIAERIQQKKMRRIAKREKKLMRPGFEGRKEGFINGP